MSIEENTHDQDPQPKPGTREYRQAALKKARNLGMNPKNGVEAVKLLRQMGLDPVAEDYHSPEYAGVPATTSPSGIVPVSEEERLAEIEVFQKALVVRRRRRLFFLFLRLAVFVILPTVLVGHY